MKKEKTQFVPKIDFKEQTPEVLIGSKKRDPLYEEAFLSREDKSESEFAENTTTWD